MTGEENEGVMWSLSTHSHPRSTADRFFAPSGVMADRRRIALQLRALYTNGQRSNKARRGKVLQPGRSWLIYTALGTPMYETMFPEGVDPNAET